MTCIHLLTLKSRETYTQAKICEALSFVENINQLPGDCPVKLDISHLFITSIFLYMGINIIKHGDIYVPVNQIDIVKKYSCPAIT